MANQLVETKHIDRVWGFEGCGSMWTFFSDKKTAYDHAGENEVYEFGLEEAHELDNRRREELGSFAITFTQFLGCIDHSLSCSPIDDDCKEQ